MILRRTEQFFASIEKRKTPSRRERKFQAAVLASLLLHGAGFFYEEIGETIEDLPRAARTILKRKEAEVKAHAVLAEVGRDLQEQRPINVDLIEFAIYREVLAGGVSEAEAKQAKAEYQRIIEEARRIKEETGDKYEVFGFILKQVGEYDDDAAFVTDLLNKKKSNCDARKEFTDGAVQDLYPELVMAGKLQTEVFGEYLDEVGNAIPGHVRAVIDEGDYIVVLEGDTPRREPIDAHEDIPRYEATSLTMKAFLASEGVYSHGENRLHQEMREERGVKDISYLDAWMMSTNSVLQYPVSHATYSPAMGGRKSVEPEPIHGSWAASREGAIELKVIPPETLTAERLDSAVTNSRFGSVKFALHLFDDVEPEAVAEIVRRTREEGIRSPISIRGGQRLPAEFFEDFPATISVVTPLETGTLEGVPIDRLVLERVENIPSALSEIQWQGDLSQLVIRPSSSAEITSDGALKDLAVKDLMFQSTVGPARLHLAKDELKALELESLEFYGVIPERLGEVHTEFIILRGAGGSRSQGERFVAPEGYFANVYADYVWIQQIERFDRAWLHEGEKTSPGLKGSGMLIEVETVEEDAFEGMRLRSLEVHAQQYLKNAFRGLEVGTLVLSALEIDDDYSLEGSEVRRLVLVMPAGVSSEDEVLSAEKLLAKAISASKGSGASIFVLGSPWGAVSDWSSKSTTWLAERDVRVMHKQQRPEELYEDEAEVLATTGGLK